jgi:hypothetical protein
MPTGIVNTIGKVIGGTVDALTGGPQKRAAEAVRETATEEAAAYEKAQEYLQKKSDEIITDMEAKYLEAKGVITSGEAEVIATLNASADGAIATLKKYNELQNSGLDSLESNMIKTYVDSGIIQRDTLTAGYAKALAEASSSKDSVMQYLTGGSTAAIDAINKGLNESLLDIEKGADESSQLLKDYAAKAYTEYETADEETKKYLEPYAQMGERAALQEQYLAGTMTAEEKAAYESKYGTVTTSAAYQSKVAEAEKLLEYQQKATGKTLSGQGIQEYKTKILDDLLATEIESQKSNALAAAQTGLSASTTLANSVQNSATNKATIQSNLGSALSQIATQKSTNTSNLRTNASQNTAGILSTTAQNKAAAQQAYSNQIQSLQTSLADLIAKQKATETSNIAGTQEKIGTTKSSNLGTLASNVSGIQSALGTSVASTQQTVSNALSNLLSALNTNKTTVKYNTAKDITNLMTGSATNTSDLNLQAINLDTQASLATWNNLMSGLKTAAAVAAVL